ncbi:hypothetical protein F7725_012393 [Dissostichus mawsoni]|uniref:Uncharacterized protein n=1 Tax=Dissostichus mawsoni TaxID=36200 RepID=A0A7J5YNU1_DISMA|nr:hypothetical protein F7725_012393 [Dissostichus mawsoni]
MAVVKMLCVAFMVTVVFSKPMCLNGEEETSDSLESIEDPPPQDPITETPLPNMIQETEPPSSLPSSPPPLLISFPPLLSEDPQTSTDPLPLLPEDPANIALFVDVSPSADLLNVLPQVDDIDLGRECLLKGLCVHLNEDPEDLLREFVMCLNGEEETSDSLESIEVSSSEETSPAVSPSQDPPPQDPITETPLPNVIQETEPPSSLPSSPPPLLISFPPLSEDPQTSTDPLPLLPEDPANIALFVDVSPSADLLNVLPHVDASASPPPEFPHPFSTAAPTLKIPLSTAHRGPCLRHVPVLHPRTRTRTQRRQQVIQRD